MQDLNNTITIDGFATDRIETTKVGKTNVTRFTVATNSFRKNKDGEYDQFTEYHTCEAWGSQSKYVSERITKGTKVKLEGKMEYGQYTKTHEKDGVEIDVTHYTSSIRVNTIQLKNKSSDED